MQSDEFKSVIDVLTHLRVSAGISQQKLASKIGKHRRTIQNWEAGIGSPTMDDVIKWIDAIGVNAMSVYLLYKYGQHALDPVDNPEEKKKRVIDYISEEMSDTEIDILYYFFSGKSGSSVYAYLQKLCADISCPMSDRQRIAASILHNYQIATRSGELSECAPSIDTEAFKDAIEKGIKASMNGKRSY